MDKGIHRRVSQGPDSVDQIQAADLGALQPPQPALRIPSSAGRPDRSPQFRFATFEVEAEGCEVEEPRVQGGRVDEQFDRGEAVQLQRIVAVAHTHQRVAVALQEALGAGLSGVQLLRHACASQVVALGGGRGRFAWRMAHGGSREAREGDDVERCRGSRLELGR